MKFKESKRGLTITERKRDVLTMKSERNMRREEMKNDSLDVSSHNGQIHGRLNIYSPIKDKEGKIRSIKQNTVNFSYEGSLAKARGLGNKLRTKKLKEIYKKRK